MLWKWKRRARYWYRAVRGAFIVSVPTTESTIRTGVSPSHGLPNPNKYHCMISNFPQIAPSILVSHTHTHTQQKTNIILTCISNHHTPFHSNASHIPKFPVQPHYHCFHWRSIPWHQPHHRIEYTNFDHPNLPIGLERLLQWLVRVWLLHCCYCCKSVCVLGFFVLVIRVCWIGGGIKVVAEKENEDLSTHFINERTRHQSPQTSFFNLFLHTKHIHNDTHTALTSPRIAPQ